MSFVNQIAKNVFSNWTGYLINVVVSFFISPFIVHTLGNTGYGIWVFVGSITGYLGIMDFGMRYLERKLVPWYEGLKA